MGLKDWGITVTSKYLKANPFFFFLLQEEQIIYDHFSDPKFVEQLITFLSLEDRKGKDKFNPRRFCLFKVRKVQSQNCSHFVDNSQSMEKTQTSGLILFQKVDF